MPVGQENVMFQNVRDVHIIGGEFTLNARPGLHPSNQAYHSYPPSAFVMDREEASSGGRNLKVRSSPNIAPTFREEAHLGPCVLSIDGGGMRGLSSLLILRAILLKIDGKKPPEPHEVFDLAGGTSTGGLIIIILFRLKMSMDLAIDAYNGLSQHVFSKKNWFFQDAAYDAKRLEDVIVLTIQKKMTTMSINLAKGLPMIHEEAPKCFVCAVAANTADRPVLFRSWMTDNVGRECTVVEAARATSAAPRFFKGIKIGKLQELFIDGGIKFSNPVNYVVQEARSISEKEPSCVVSIGTGSIAVAHLEQPNFTQNIFTTKLIKVIQDIATDCETTANNMAKEMFHQAIPYFRFNVDRGLHDLLLNEWERLDIVQSSTDSYLDKHDVIQDLNRLASMLRNQRESRNSRPLIADNDNGPVGTKSNTKKTDSYELKGDPAGINEDAIFNGVLQLLPIHPENEGSMRSLHSNFQTKVFFVNRRASPVQLWWLNFEGRRVSYGSVQPNARMEMTTYVTHPWVITDVETGASLGIWSPAATTGLILIK